MGFARVHCCDHRREEFEGQQRSVANHYCTECARGALNKHEPVRTSGDAHRIVTSEVADHDSCRKIIIPVSDRGNCCNPHTGYIATFHICYTSSGVYGDMRGAQFFTFINTRYPFDPETTHYRSKSGQKYFTPTVASVGGGGTFSCYVTLFWGNFM